MKLKFSPLLTGLMIGVWAGLSQAVLDPATPLDYAVTMGRHPADLLNWLLNALFKVNLPVGQISIGWPVPTVIGVIVGAVVASLVHGESGFGTRPFSLGDARNGFLVAIFLWLLGSCPIKAVTWTAYGDLVMLLGVIAIVIGAVFASFYVRRRERH
jgi:uncharacterized membrane protein